ncbi:hypothetical protein J6590_097052 [Homalodisca vitripennis]|nr:hypothetical protein J6590_097052 [Homalodisca vitripennis]
MNTVRPCKADFVGYVGNWPLLHWRFNTQWPSFRHEAFHVKCRQCVLVTFGLHTYTCVLLDNLSLVQDINRVREPQHLLDEHPLHHPHTQCEYLCFCAPLVK